ncbi:uncharacterized protein LOC118182920 [Stegodyphus dumicola]|uniref:uncharacterized protein LOC118182920 n=1 Tax=Stegodyphus dumicola TaxID=202533 RepID=UPI0015AB5A0A|nr:uncharacterized protein LOC118182920 [Stegodyphus dumicola]
MFLKGLVILLFLVLPFEQRTLLEDNESFCRPHLCKYVSCWREEALCKYPGAKRIPKGGICGCCDRCVIVKKRNQQCFALSERHGAIPIECEEGTACSIVSLRCE